LVGKTCQRDLSFVVCLKVLQSSPRREWKRIDALKESDQDL
jgi:hypothetical protein